MGLKERLLSFIEFKTLSVQRFEQEVGLSNASVSKMGDNTRRSTIDRISNKFPDININWLLTGEGEMLNPNSGSLNGKTTQSNAINSRIRQIINDYFNGSIAEFCGKLNLRQATIITTLERNIPASHEILMAIIGDSSLNISSDWLMTGEGEMRKQTDANLSVQTNASFVRTHGNDVYLETSSGIKYFELSDNKYRMRVPLVPFNAYARYANETCSGIVQERETWDEVEFIVDKIGHGNYMGFEIKGDSMDDDSRRSFAQGDLVLARELDKTHWMSGLKYEKYPFWIIVLENTILCKQIVEHNIKTGDIICHSLNPSPEYSDFTINLSKVCRIFNIIQKTLSAS